MRVYVNTFEVIWVSVLCLTQAGARITVGWSEDNDLGTYFRFLLCSLNKRVASKTDLSWSNEVVFHSFFPRPCANLHLMPLIEDVMIEEFVWEVPMSTQTLTHVRSALPAPTDVPCPNLIGCPVSIPGG